MPELPDVELFKRHLDETCRDRTIAHVTVTDRRILRELSPARLAARLKGARIAGSRRHGKHLLADLGKSGWLTFHFGMTGSLQHFADGEDEPLYDRLRLDFSDGDHLAYADRRLLGRVGLAEDADAFVKSEELGPDALEPNFDLAAFAKAVTGPRRDLKSVLMDQSIVAGIGNIYSDEMLFQARLHPTARSDRLDAPALKRLYQSMKNVLTTAIDRRAGSENFLERLPKGYLLPERRKGGRCPACGGPVETAKFSGRTAYFCPRCQPPPSRAAC